MSGKKKTAPKRVIVGNGSKGFSLKLCLLCGIVRDRHRYHGSTAFARRDRQGSAAHDIKPLPDVIKCGMRPAFIGGVKTDAVVVHNELSSGICVSCPDGDM